MSVSVGEFYDLGGYLESWLRHFRGDVIGVQQCPDIARYERLLLPPRDLTSGPEHLFGHRLTRTWVKARRVAVSLSGKLCNGIPVLILHSEWTE